MDNHRYILLNIHSLDPTVRLRTCIYSWLSCIISIIHLFHFSFPDRKRTASINEHQSQPPCCPIGTFYISWRVFPDISGKPKARPNDAHTRLLPPGDSSLYLLTPSFSVFKRFFLSEKGVNSPINIVFSRCLPTHCFQIIRQDYSTGFTINPLIPSLPGFPPHSSYFFNTLTLLLSLLFHNLLSH